MKIFLNFWKKEKRENFLFEKVALLSFSDFERRRSSVLLQAWLRQAHQKIVVNVETNIFTDRFFWKVYQFFVISVIPAKSFHSFDENVSTGWSQLQSRCTEAHFEEKDFSFEKFIGFLAVYWNVSGKSVIFRTKLFGRVVRIAFSVARESFLMKEKFWSKNCNFIFLGIGENFSCFRRQFYGKLVKNSLYMFRRKFWGKMAFRKVFHFFILPGIPAKSFQSSEENFLAGLSQLLLYMYIGTFLGKLFSFRKVQSFFRGFRNLSCKCVDSQRKLFATVVKIAFSVAKEAFLMKKINLFKKL